jgi:hypothetical protein
MCNQSAKQLGAKPAHIQWTVVRGDSASLRVDFLENDESTFFDTEDWEYKATAYDPQGNVLDNLIVDSGTGYAIIYADPAITKNWGTSYNRVVSELPFDLQVNLPADCIEETWTPIVGTICVIGDISPSGSL